MTRRKYVSPKALDASLLPKQRKPIPHPFVLDAYLPAPSRTLFRGDDSKGGPALLDVLGAAFRAHDLALLVVDERQDRREEFLAVMAKEFVVRHIASRSKVDKKNCRLKHRPLPCTTNERCDGSYCALPSL
jgi:hypothetical protein